MLFGNRQGRDRACRILLLTSLLLAGLYTATAEAARPVILVFGDSLSAGFGIDHRQGWTVLLQDRLDNSPFRFTVQNASISGETSAGGLGRLPRALQIHRPAIVIIELGGNDGLRGLALDAMRSNLGEMIKLCTRAGARVLLVGMHLPPNYGPAYTREFYNSYRQLAEQHKVSLLPFLLDGIATERSLMQSDGIHPVAAAQPLIIDNLWPRLLPLLELNARKSD